MPKPSWLNPWQAVITVRLKYLFQNSLLSNTFVWFFFFLFDSLWNAVLKSSAARRSIIKSVTQAGVRLFEAQCFCFGVYQYADAEKHLIL